MKPMTEPTVAPTIIPTLVAVGAIKGHAVITPKHINKELTKTTKSLILHTGNDLQVDEAGLESGRVAGCAHVLPRHVTAQVAQLQGAGLII